MQADKDPRHSLDTKGIIFAVSGGFLSAVLALSLATGSALALLLAYLAPFPLFLVGLSKGQKATTLCVSAAVFFTGLMGGVLSAVVFAFMTGIPCAILILLALRHRMSHDRVEWFSAGTLLAILPIYGSLLFIIGYMVFGTGGQPLEMVIQDFFSQVINSLAATLPSEAKTALITQISGIFVAMILISWSFMTLVNAIMAQAVLTKAQTALRPTPRYSQLRLPDVASWAFVAVAIVTVISDGTTAFIARNLSLALCLPFLFLGLSVVHQAVRLTRFSGALLSGLYLLLLLSLWVAVPLIGLGLIEQWIGVRKYLAAKHPHSGE